MTRLGALLLGVVVFTGIGAASVKWGAAGSGNAQTAAVKASDAQFSTAFGGALMLRKSMRDPRSFEVSSVIDTSIAHGQTVCYSFRSRNGFGGMDDSRAVLWTNTRDASQNGMLMESQKGFRSAWLAFCASGQGRDMTDLVRVGLRQYNARP